MHYGPIYQILSTNYEGFFPTNNRNLIQCVNRSLFVVEIGKKHFFCYNGTSIKDVRFFAIFGDTYLPKNCTSFMDVP